MMLSLTQFQVETEAELRVRLEERDLSVSNRQVCGNTEPYIAGEVRDVKVWIYTDEACVIGRGIDRVFERPDFESATALRDAFVEQVLALFGPADAEQGD